MRRTYTKPMCTRSSSRVCLSISTWMPRGSRQPLTLIFLFPSFLGFSYPVYAATNAASSAVLKPRLAPYARKSSLLHFSGIQGFGGLLEPGLLIAAQGDAMSSRTDPTIIGTWTNLPFDAFGVGRVMPSECGHVSIHVGCWNVDCNSS